MNDFGNALRRLRVEKGMSLADLATLTHYSKGYLSKVESGVRPASAAIARVCDNALGTDGRLLAKVQHDDRPGGLALPPIADTFLTAPALGDDRFHGDLEGYTEQFWTVFETLRLMGHSMSPEIVLPMALANIDTVSRVLRSARPAPRHGLVLLAARFKEYAGWMAQEAGQIYLARRLTEEAAQLARTAGDLDLPQFALVRQADIALYQGDGREVVELTGRVLDCPYIKSRTRSIASQRQAQGYALLGDHSNFQRALENVHRSVAADPVEAGVRSLGTTSVPNPAEMTSGWSQVDLCQHVQAAETLRRVVSGMDTGSVRQRVRISTRLALAYASCGEVEQALNVVRTALEDIRRVDSDSVRVDLRTLAGVLRRRWSRSIPVGDLLSELRPQLGGTGRPG